jgi:hypothetical protein
LRKAPSTFADFSTLHMPPQIYWIGFGSAAILGLLACFVPAWNASASPSSRPCASPTRAPRRSWLQPAQPHGAQTTTAMTALGIASPSPCCWASRRSSKACARRSPPVGTPSR